MRLPTINNNNKSGRRRRVPVSSWTTTGMALVFLLATNTHQQCHAFLLPRRRSCPIARATTSSSTVAMRSTTGGPKRAQLEFEQRSEESSSSKKNTDSSNKKLTNNGIQSNNGTELRNGAKAPPGTPLSMICEEAAEESFEIHVGRALDTLRSDYPHILTDQPDFSIFDQRLEVIDPSGVKLHGLKNYKNAFRLMHAIIQVFYCPERSGLTFRLCYDTARQNIRVSWNAEVVPKAIFGGVRTTLHVDGISVYEMCRESGMITQHRIERLVMNDTPVKPKQGIYAMLRNEHDETVPVFNSLAIEDDTGNFQSGTANLGNALEFRSGRDSQLFGANNQAADEDASTSTALLAVSAGDNNDGSDTASSSDAVNSQDYPGLDWDAYERKNASRKKFGLDPLTPEEFLENEAVIKQMDSQQRQRASSASAAAEMANQNKSRQQGFLERLFGDIIPEACESNFDCERPEICCDFGFKKVCCASGTMVGNQMYEPALVPVPADVSYPPEEQRRNF